MINPVIHVIAEFVAAGGLANDLADGSASGRNQKPPWLGQNLDRLGKEAVEFVVNLLGQRCELRHAGVVGSRKAAPNVEQLQIEAS